MRIIHIHIDGFGKWKDADFDVDEQLQVFVGANEAGKTTLHKFINGVLFGFATGKHPEEQYLPKDGGLYGGSVTVIADDSSHTQYRIKRTDGKAGGEVTIFNVTAGAVEPAERLQTIIGSVDQQVNDATFSFGVDELRNLTTLNRADLMTTVQRLGAVGSTAWLSRADKLQAASDELYKQRGRNPELNQALNTYHELQEKVGQAADRYPAFVALQQDIIKAETTQQQLVEQINQAQLQQAELSRLVRLWPTYAALRQLTETLPEKQSVISETDYLTVTKLQNQVEALTADIADKTAQLQESSTKDEELDFYAAHQEQFDEQANQFDEIGNEIQTRQLNREQVASHQAELAQLQQQYGLAGELPTPLSSEEQQTVDQQLAAINPQPVERQWRVSGVGVLVLIIGLFLSGSFRWLAILLGAALIAAGWFGWFTVRSPQPVKKDDNVLQSLATEHHLENVEPATWAGMQNDVRRMQTLHQQLSDLDEQISVANQHINQFFSNYAFAEEWLQLRDVTASEVLTKAQSFDRRLRVANTQLKADAAHRTASVNRIVESQSNLQDVQSQLATLLTKNQFATVNQFIAAYEQQLAGTKDVARKEALGNQLTPEIEAKLAQFADQNQLANQLQVATAKVSDLQQTLRLQQQQLADQRADFKHQSSDVSYADLQQQLANQETIVTDLAQQWLTQQLAAQWIQQALAAASADRIPIIVNRAETLFAAITLKHYTKITYVADQLRVTDQEGTVFLPTELSRGTVEQLYVALRISLALVMAEQTKMPLLIDDALVDFDDERKAALVTILKDISEQVQVIYFTADAHVHEQFSASQINEL